MLKIRFLMDGPHGNMIHSTVPLGMVARACRFRTIDEFWYILSGEGELWRRAPYAALVNNLDVNHN